MSILICNVECFVYSSVMTENDEVHDIFTMEVDVDCSRHPGQRLHVLHSTTKVWPRRHRHPEVQEVKWGKVRVMEPVWMESDIIPIPVWMSPIFGSRPYSGIYRWCLSWQARYRQTTITNVICFNYLSRSFHPFHIGF